MRNCGRNNIVPSSRSGTTWNGVQSIRVTQEPTAPIVREWAPLSAHSVLRRPIPRCGRTLILLDTYGFPAAYRKYRNWEYLAPNLDTSAWFHCLSPSSDWLLIDHECTVAGRGLMGVSGKVWDTDGRLVATGAAQLCCVPNRND